MREHEEAAMSGSGPSSHGQPPARGPGRDGEEPGRKRKVIKPDSYFSDEDASDHD